MNKLDFIISQYYMSPDNPNLEQLQKEIKGNIRCLLNCYENIQKINGMSNDEIIAFSLSRLEKAMNNDLELPNYIKKVDEFFDSAFPITKKEVKEDHGAQAPKVKLDWGEDSDE